MNKSLLLVALGALGFAAGCSGDDGDSDGPDGGGTPALTVQKVPYSDPNILYSGRIYAPEGKAPRFSAPAVHITARFKGTDVAMRVDDYASSANFFDVVIDGDYATAQKVKPDVDGLAEIVTGLPYAEHTITLVKRTEANTGQVEFRGFDILGEILPPPPVPERKILIVGDSISAGSGNEALDGSAECMQDYGRPYSDASKAWGPMLARAVDADYEVTAVSGIGIIRNYNCTDNAPMPAVYDRIYLESSTSPEWDHSKFVPDAIVIMIGTNDFSPAACMRPPLSEEYDAENYELWISEYVAFVEKLRGLHPNAEIFLTSTPMLNDGWPDATYASDTDQRAAVTRVAAELDDERVHLVLGDYDATRYGGKGCGTHPNAFDHSVLAGFDPGRPDDPAPAALLLNPVREVMGW
jgi:lysophospholipase L1-like esterase